MTEERTTETITGLVAEIITKGPEKWQAVVKETPDQQYGRKLWTKDKDVFATVTALIGQTATFECGVSVWQGDKGPVRSLWINAVNPGSPPPQEPMTDEEIAQKLEHFSEATGATQSAPNPPDTESPVQTAAAVPAPRERDSFGDPRQASIERQVALKCAVEFIASRDKGTDITDTDVIRVAEAFDQFLARVVPF
jgi:hypothetical protein